MIAPGYRSPAKSVSLAGLFDWVSILPKQRRLNAVFDPYLQPTWGTQVLMGGPSTRRFFAFGLAAAGAAPLASRLPFSSANAAETAVRAVPVAPVIPKTFKAFGGVRIDNYDWLRDRNDPRLGVRTNSQQRTLVLRD